MPRTSLYTRNEACGPENRRNVLQNMPQPARQPTKRIVEQMWPLESVPLEHDCTACSKEPVVSKRLVVADKARHRCRPSESVVSLLAGLTSTRGVKRNENCKDTKQRKRKEKIFLARNLILLLENGFEIFFINESGNRDGPAGTG